VTQAVRVNQGWSEEGAKALNTENASAIARLGYDPNTAPRKPSPEELNKAAAAIFSKIRLKTPRT
jgi:hypothetical protein